MTPDANPEATPATFGPPPEHPFVDDVTATDANYDGAVFATDAHRRVLGHMPTPTEPRTSYDLLRERVVADGGNPLLSAPAPFPAGTESPGHAEAFDTILGQLVAEGYADDELGWRMTPAGFEAITR